MFEFLKRPKTIQFNIVASFSFLILFGFLSIMSYTYYNNTKSMVSFSKILISEAKNKSKLEIVTFLKDAEKTAILMSKLVDESADLDVKNRPLINYMIELVKIYPQVSPIYVGDKNGNFLAVRSVALGDTYRSSRKLLSNAVKFAIRFVNNNVDKPYEMWQYVAANGTVIDEEVLAKLTYDPRVRPWYRGVEQKRDVYWTDVYIFQASRKPGITVAFPLYSQSKKFFGVLGSDINVGKISEKLRENQVSKFGTIFIASRDGELISHPDPSKSIVVKGDSIKPVMINELDDEKIREAFQQFSWRKVNQFIFETKSDGKQYVADFADLPKDFGKDWVVGVIVPVDIFVGNIKEIQKITIYMAILIFIISVIFVWIIANRLSKPVVVMTNETNKLRELDLDGDVAVDSNILEIKMMKKSIEMLKKSLKSFSKYVPKSLVKRLMSKGIEVKIGGRPKELTLFFSDIAGFTTVSESYPPEKLMTHLSEYFEELTGIIGSYHGTVDKYIGDAIMAFWGAPVSDKHHALNACRAALHCQRRLFELNRKWDSLEKPRLYTRIGIHTGEVIVGNMGSSDRMNYTVIGDGVNLAARLEGLNKYYDTKIMISEDTYQLVDKDCLVRPIDKVKVKGKEQPVTVYELIALKKASQAGDSKIMPSRSQREMVVIFSRAYNAYLEKRWDDAIKDFELFEENFGKDLPCQLYIERCKHYKKNPPEDNWDGSYKMIKK